MPYTVYGNKMDNAFKTTVYLEAAEYRKLKAIAEAEGRSTAELIREAVKEYGARRSTRSKAHSIGGFRSGQPDLAARTDELLDGFGK